ncbi:hypothetical protein [Streptomyces prasinus]|uniref:hypothetical protein n=1 Tax=Streptomyces prasinus TaxID=67345 RepID=UPI0036C62584
MPAPPTGGGGAARFPAGSVVRDRSLSLFGTVWPEVYGTRHLGAVRSPVVAVLVFASALGPGAGGLLLDAGVGQPAQLVVLDGYCLMVSVLVVPLPRRLRARTSAVPHREGVPSR